MQVNKVHSDTTFNGIYSFIPQKGVKMPQELYDYLKQGSVADKFVTGLDKELNITLSPCRAGSNSLICNMEIGHDDVYAGMYLNWNKGVDVLKQQFENIAKKLSELAPMNKNPHYEEPGDIIRLNLKEYAAEMENPIEII